MIDSGTQTDDIIIKGISIFDIVKNNKLYDIVKHNNDRNDRNEDNNIDSSEDNNIDSSEDNNIDSSEEDTDSEYGDNEYGEVLSEKEIECLYESIFISIDEHVVNNPLAFSDPAFHNKLENYIYEVIEASFSDSITSDEDVFNFSEKMECQIEEVVNLCLQDYFDSIVPPRSYPNSCILKAPNIEETRRKIEYLKSIPQDEQRTMAWYIFRNNLITASAAWKVFKTESCINQLIYEKCKSNSNFISTNSDEINDIDKNRELILDKTYVNTNSPLHWGQKYEKLSVIIYESRNNTKIGEFGCIRHPTYDFLGASPDGINVDPTSPLYGRMLEIKNIVNREITGIPIEEYWIQTQLQMQVCNCDECDFLETSFKEYEDEEAFLHDSCSENDAEFHLTSAKTLKGVIAYFMKDGKPFYEYGPLYLTRTEYDKWCEEIIDKNAGITWLKNIYWYLNHYSCVLIRKNNIWFQEAVKKIENVWNVILTERETGYEHRAPKKRNPKKKTTSLDDDQNNILGSGSGSGCLIVISDLELNL